MVKLVISESLTYALIIRIQAIFYFDYPDLVDICGVKITHLHTAKFARAQQPSTPIFPIVWNRKCSLSDKVSMRAHNRKVDTAIDA